MNFNSLLSQRTRSACALLALCFTAATPALAQETIPAPRPEAPAAAPTLKPSGSAAGQPIDSESGQSGTGASVEQLYERVRDWDKKRGEAANAMFRLGEVYRKQGKFDQAQQNYLRVAREFQDIPELAKQSEARLAEMNGSVNALRTPGFGSMTAGMMARSTATLAAQPAADAGGLYSTPAAADPGNPRYAQAEKSRAESSRAAELKASQLAADLAAKARAYPRSKGEASNYAAGLGNTRGMAGYMDAMGRGKVPSAVEQLEMRAIEVRAFRSTLQEEQARLKTVISLVQNAAHPEAFSSDVIDDLRYRAIKDKLEQLILDEASFSEIDSAAKRIKNWLDRIYLPELGSSCDFNEMRLARAEKEATELDSELASMKKDAAREMGIGSGDPFIAPPVVAPGTSLNSVFVPGPPLAIPTTKSPKNAPGKAPGPPSAAPAPETIPAPSPLPVPTKP